MQDGDMNMAHNGRDVWEAERQIRLKTTHTYLPGTVILISIISDVDSKTPSNTNIGDKDT